MEKHKKDLLVPSLGGRYRWFHPYPKCHTEDGLMFWRAELPTGHRIYGLRHSKRRMLIHAALTHPQSDRYISIFSRTKTPSTPLRERIEHCLHPDDDALSEDEQERPEDDALGRAAQQGDDPEAETASPEDDALGGEGEQEQQQGEKAWTPLTEEDWGL